MKRLVFVFAATLTGAVLAVGGVACGAMDQTALGGLEDCVNGVDDNADGWADCEDPQCSGHAACLGMRELSCGNGADDDGDGLIDCDDPDCTQTQECDASREWNCHDGVDNDVDGLTDCLDPDCEQTCTENCTDGVDNDGDGKVDCDDPDCYGAEGCRAGDEICGNGYDDDGDGLVDCEDPDCQGRPVCIVVEICNNEIDDDGDGLVNCADPDCYTNPYCIETNCLDGQDNDEDGLVDCDDPDCAGALICQSGTECLPAQPLSCEHTVESTTEGRLNNFSSYDCLTGTFPGPERYYEFTAPRDMILDISLYDWDGRGLTMIATEGDPSAGCDFSNICIPQPIPGDPYMPVLVYEGATMYLIIDGTSAIPGPFDLWMSCTPTDETGLCDDGLDNDFDTWEDCWDDDCTGDPVCDYWVSAGSFCYNDYDCPQQEYCENVTFQGTANTIGFCTRNCSAPGTTGGDCDTAGHGAGLCSADLSAQGPRCLLPCTDPADVCPPGNECTNLISGSVSDVSNGFCLPYQL